mmetsp:Transcript_47000/g.117218  ORF Transcript_47000/g.117218 Transcript_47000/m.117218 type:complete len:204 (-) Transcript_47000:325-936(-)
MSRATRYMASGQSRSAAFSYQHRASNIRLFLVSGSILSLTASSTRLSILALGSPPDRVIPSPGNSLLGEGLSIMCTSLVCPSGSSDGRMASTSPSSSRAPAQVMPSGDPRRAASTYKSKAFMGLHDTLCPYLNLCPSMQSRATSSRGSWGSDTTTGANTPRLPSSDSSRLILRSASTRALQMALAKVDMNLSSSTSNPQQSRR